MPRKTRSKVTRVQDWAAKTGKKGFGLYLDAEYMGMLNDLKKMYEQKFAEGGVKVKISLSSIVRGAINQAYTKEFGFAAPATRKKAT